MKKLSSFILFFTIVFLIAVIVACTSHMQKYRGTTVDRDSRVELLEDGPHKGTWQTFDLTLEYQYERKLDMLQISGNIELSHHYTGLYEKVRSCSFYLYFIDKGGKVTESKRIVDAFSHNIDDKFPLKQKLTMPPDTVFITFGYEATVQASYQWDFFSNYPHYEKHSISVTPGKDTLEHEYESRFIKYDNGVVYDTKTGLEWYDAGRGKTVTQDDAKFWVSKLKVDGGGWRMPTIKELRSLYGRNVGERNITPLLNPTGWIVWSGEEDGPYDLGLNFQNASQQQIGPSYGTSSDVFAVRTRKE